MYNLIKHILISTQEKELNINYTAFKDVKTDTSGDRKLDSFKILRNRFQRVL